MKKTLLLLIIFSIFSEASALSCTDLSKNLVRGAENGDVLALQNFLYEKGYLKAKPNGYFGTGTFSAVKSYQNAKGLSRSGQVFPLTRETIKKDSCGTVTTQTSSNANVQNTNVSSSGSQVSQTVSTAKVLSGQEIRQRDVNAILSALYKYYQETGAYPTLYTSTAQDICTYGIGECDGMVEIKSRVVPKYLSYIPSDPSVGSSTKSGYTIFRSQESNDITIGSGYKIGFTTVSASCNFVGGCLIKETDTSQKTPSISGLDNTIFLLGGRLTAPLVIQGSGFSAASNTVLLTSEVNRKTYTLGMFTSTDGKTINASTSFTYAALSCGNNCSETLPLGSFLVSVKNAGGESGFARLALKSATAKAVPNSPDASFTPSTKHRKLATISISSEDVVTLENLEFTMIGSSTLTTKVTNFTLTDLLSGSIINGGPKFSLGSKPLSNNDSKIYELYADIGEVETHLSGRVVFQGVVKVKGNLNKNVASIPLDDFMITISY